MRINNLEENHRHFDDSVDANFAMETAMNVTDVLLTGGALLTWWAMPLMLLAGFLTPWPYNYWRLKKYNASCH